MGKNIMVLVMLTLLPLGLFAEESSSEELLPAICRQILADESQGSAEIIWGTLTERVKSIPGQVVSGVVEKASNIQETLISKIVPEKKPAPATESQKQKALVLGAAASKAGISSSLYDKGTDTLNFLVEHWRWVASGLVFIFLSRWFFF